MDCSIAKLEGAWQWRNAFKILKEPKLLHAIYKYEGSRGKIYSQTCNNSEIYSQILFLMQLLEGSVPAKSEINQNKDLESK